MFPRALVEHLNSESSDHCPIILRVEQDPPRNYRPFRFFEVWSSDQTSFQVVKDAWEEDWKDGMEWHKLRRSLFNTSKTLKKWNREHFSFAQFKIKTLEEELSLVNNDNTKEAQIKEEIRTQRARWEAVLRQKSREVWLKEGNKNTKFFHTSVTV